MHIYYCRLFSFIILLPFFSQAQDFNQQSASEIKLALQKLNNTGSVLYIAAHPDDENTRLLAYLAKERKVRTGYLSITRGDGGQNLLGTEQAELLGVIRTQELLAARKVDGAEQFFTRAIDFGFSKTSEESLRLWGKEQTLSDVVWVIRNFKPDVIITRFPEDARAGHGQHSASAILANEAFLAAADPKRFPEQLAYVKPWQAKRVIWNTFNFNAANNTTSDDQLKINVGLYNPLLGKSYGEIAAQSRTNHKSQGFGTASQRGDLIEYFTHISGSKAETDLFDGVDLSWKRFKYGKEISDLLIKTDIEFNETAPYESVGNLLKVKQLLEKTDTNAKLKDVEALIVACTGIWIEINTPEPRYALGDSIPVRLQAIARVPQDFKYKITLSEVLSKQNNLQLQPNKFISVSGKILFPNQEVSQPYWLQQNHKIGSYIVPNQMDIGDPENQASLSGIFTIKIGNDAITFRQPLVYKFTDQVRGEVYQPLAIAPPVTATLSGDAYIFSNSHKNIEVELQSFRDNVSGTVQLQVPDGWKVSPQSIPFSLAKKGSLDTKEFTLTPGGTITNGNLLVNVKVNDRIYTQSIKEINYDHIPAQTLFPKATARLEKLDLKTSGRRIAYIAGAGDLIAESLKQIGYDVTLLSSQQVINTNLSNFDAIITGVRLYNVDPQIKAVQSKLFEYIYKGGVMLSQYNVNNPLQVQNIGPFPFSLSRDRVVDEEAKVTFLAPTHRILNYPNKITEKDFEGWVQERGLYFIANADQAYLPILSFNDTGETPNNGSLLVAEYGKGKFVYTSLAFFRQLPAGVPGAYRLFVNLISK
ncbi:PIG-L family deacetylase [Pedobacter sp. P351]|uniref:PIG-L family deacetylase n=1 Tax=Pedobacter superstes TaxID=3133441 RepID=UPI0030B77E33